MTWGWSLSLDLARCCPSAIRSPTIIKAFSKQLVKDIDMVAYGEPLVEHFGYGSKSGYTLVQLIQTSNITAHFAEEDSAVFLDVFSCKPFEAETVERLCKEYFKPDAINSVLLERKIPELK